MINGRWSLRRLTPSVFCFAKSSSLYTREPWDEAVYRDVGIKSAGASPCPTVDRLNLQRCKFFGQNNNSNKVISELTEQSKLFPTVYCKRDIKTKRNRSTQTNQIFYYFSKTIGSFSEHTSQKSIL